MYDPDFDWDEAEKLLELQDAERTRAECQDTGNEAQCRWLARWNAHDAQVNQLATSWIRGCLCTLYTGCWDSASLRLWSWDGLTAPERYQELHTGGFLNAVLELAERQVLVAVSAGLLPTPGESLKLCDLRDLRDVDETGAVRAVQTIPMERFYFHTRGCRALAAPLEGPEVASISKDALAISKTVSSLSGGVSLESCHVIPKPHDLQEVTALSFGQTDSLYSGGTDGCVKAWDVGSGFSSWRGSVSAGCWVRKMVMFCGCLVVCHSDGVSWIDPRLGTVVGHLEGQGRQAHAGCVLDAQRLVVSLGRQLTFLDLRLAKENVFADLDAVVSSLEAYSASPAQINLLAGMKNGVVQTFDATFSWLCNWSKDAGHSQWSHSWRKWIICQGRMYVLSTSYNHTYAIPCVWCLRPEQVEQELQKEPEPSTPAAEKHSEGLYQATQIFSKQ